MTMDTTSKLVMGYAIIIFSFSISLVYSHNENAICSQLQSVTQLCSGNSNDHYTAITTGVPGKRGSKGEKGDSSTYVTNEEKNRRFSSKLASLHVQLTSVQDENRRLKEELDEAKEVYNNKITEVEDKILRILSEGMDFDRLKICGLLRLPSNIENSRFSASTYWSNRADHAPYHGRLFNTNGVGCWVPQNKNGNEWILVDLKQNRRIYGVASQGRNRDLDQWTTSYKVSYKSNINESFRDIEDESGSTKVFQGNTDRNTPIVNDFPQPITSRYFRINPLTFNDRPSIRFDLLIC